MKSNSDAMTRAQELARRNNEAAAVHAAYLRRRAMRKRPGKKSTRSSKRLDDLDWLAAEREAKPARAVGFFVERPMPPPVPRACEGKTGWVSEGTKGANGDSTPNSKTRSFLKRSIDGES